VALVARRVACDIYKPVALWVISETILHYSRLKLVLHGSALIVGAALAARRVACDIYKPVALWVISETILHYSRLKPVLHGSALIEGRL